MHVLCLSENLVITTWYCLPWGINTWHWLALLHCEQSLWHFESCSTSFFAFRGVWLKWYGVVQTPRTSTAMGMLARYMWYFYHDWVQTDLLLYIILWRLIYSVYRQPVVATTTQTICNSLVRWSIVYYIPYIFGGFKFRDSTNLGVWHCISNGCNWYTCSISHAIFFVTKPYLLPRSH